MQKEEVNNYSKHILPEEPGDKGGWAKLGGSAPVLNCAGAIFAKPALGSTNALLFIDGVDTLELVGGLPDVTKGP